MTRRSSTHPVVDPVEEVDPGPDPVTEKEEEKLPEIPAVPFSTSDLPPPPAATSTTGAVEPPRDRMPPRLTLRTSPPDGARRKVVLRAPRRAGRRALRVDGAVVDAAGNSALVERAVRRR